jgi:aminoglycoside 6'-N-acetyltransferase I
MVRKGLGALVLAHAFSPIDLIPDFVPVLGYLDDLLLAPAGIALALRMIPAEVMKEARSRAAAQSPEKRVGRIGAGNHCLNPDIGYNRFLLICLSIAQGKTMTLDVHPALIRQATQADQSEWSRMRHALWPEVESEDLLHEMERILADPLTPVFVIERPDGRLGGFLEAGTRKYADGCETSPVGYIEGWYVDEDLRGQGVGRALVNAAEEWARGQGLKEMASDTWLENEVSIAAHLKMGYEEVERLIHFAKTL